MTKHQPTIVGEYNGYANKPTWTVALWVDNDEGLSDSRDELVLDAYRRAAENSDDADDRRRDVADAIETWVGELIDETAKIPSASMVSDLLSWAVAFVDWDDLAETWIADLPADELKSDDEEDSEA